MIFLWQSKRFMFANKDLLCRNTAANIINLGFCLHHKNILSNENEFYRIFGVFKELFNILHE